MYIEPSQQAYQFILRSYFEGMGQAQPAPPLVRSSIHFALKAGSHSFSDRVHLLDKTPESLNPDPCGDWTGVFRIGFGIDTRGLPRGMYELSAYAKSDPVTLRDAGTVTPHPEMYAPYHIYIPSPMRIPRARIGQRFLIFPNAATRYFDESGTLIPRRDIVMKIANLEKVEGSRYTFAVEGVSRKIAVTSTLPISQLPGLLPLVEDEVATQLNTRYAGKEVWQRGGWSVDCVTDSFYGNFSLYETNAKPQTITHVFRVFHAAYELAIGHQIQSSGGYRLSSFIDEAPLLVWLRVPYENAGEMPASCLAWFGFLADAWDFEREYSAEPVTQAHPDWPRDVLEAIAKGQVIKAMTREQVAWAIGYPAIYATPAQLDHLAVWRYDDTIFDYLVKFDANGRVSSFGPTGQLP